MSWIRICQSFYIFHSALHNSGFWEAWLIWFNHFLLDSGVVGSTVVLQQKGPGFESFLLGLCMLSLCMCGFPVGVPASSHCPKTWLLGSLVSLNCSCVGLSCSSLRCPVMDWGHVQGGPCLPPTDSWRWTPAAPAAQHSIEGNNGRMDVLFPVFLASDVSN